jgi:predicted phage terminase large subunit-like protein
MQRLHEDDFVGHILGLDDWEVVSFPAIAQEDADYVVETPHGAYVHRWLEGEPLQPAREPLSILAQLQRSLGSAHFSAQYLQMPIAPGGGLIKPQWFVRFNLGEEPGFDRIIQSWDTANKTGELNDYSVCTTWGRKGKDYWLLDVLRKRMEFPDLKRKIVEHAALHRAHEVVVEDMASGTSTYQQLRRDALPGLTPYRPKGDKVMRLNNQTALIEAGRVHLPDQAHWLEDYLHELAVFPNGKHDDQVDSTSQALDWMNNMVNT